MRHSKIVILCLFVGLITAVLSPAMGASQHIRPQFDPRLADKAPCTEYNWQGKALVKGFDGDLVEIIGHGTVCADSRNEAHKLAHQEMHDYASRFGSVIYCGADIG